MRVGEMGTALLAGGKMSFHPHDLRQREPFADQIERQLIIVKVFDDVGTRLDNVPNQDPGVEGISGTPAVTDFTQDHDLASRGNLNVGAFLNQNGELKAQARSGHIQHCCRIMSRPKGKDPNGNRIITGVSWLTPFFAGWSLA